MAQPSYEQGSKNISLNRLDEEVIQAIGDQKVQIKKELSGQLQVV